jgi:hypothetical protein
MPLLPVHFNTTNLNKRKKPKKKTKVQLQVEQEHRQQLKRMGLDRPLKAAPKFVELRSSLPSIPDRNLPPTSDVVPAGNTNRVEPKYYNGENRLIGIATMHKSNMVPIFESNKEAAIDIARMRRG